MLFMRFALCIAVITMTALNVGHALNCPEPPQQVTHEVTNDVNIEIRALKQWIGKFGIGNKTEVAAKNLYEKYPNADRLVVAQMIISVFCSLLEDAEDIPSSDKIQLFWEAQEKLIALVNSEDQKLIKLLEYRASEILSSMDYLEVMLDTEGKTKLEIIRKKIKSLHNSNIVAISEGDRILSHEITGKIHHWLYLLEEDIKTQAIVDGNVITTYFQMKEPTTTAPTPELPELEEFANTYPVPGVQLEIDETLLEGLRRAIRGAGPGPR